MLDLNIYVFFRNLLAQFSKPVFLLPGLVLAAGAAKCAGSAPPRKFSEPSPFLPQNKRVVFVGNPVASSQAAPLLAKPPRTCDALTAPIARNDVARTDEDTGPFSRLERFAGLMDFGVPAHEAEISSPARLMDLRRAAAVLGLPKGKIDLARDTAKALALTHGADLSNLVDNARDLGVDFSVAAKATGRQVFEDDMVSSWALHHLIPMDIPTRDRTVNAALSIFAGHGKAPTYLAMVAASLGNVD